jgi:hypothetical protein
MEKQAEGQTQRRDGLGVDLKGKNRKCTRSRAQERSGGCRRTRMYLDTKTPRRATNLKKSPEKCSKSMQATISTIYMDGTAIRWATLSRSKKREGVSIKVERHFNINPPRKAGADMMDSQYIVDGKKNTYTRDGTFSAGRVLYPSTKSSISRARQNAIRKRLPGSRLEIVISIFMMRTATLFRILGCKTMCMWMNPVVIK